MKFLFVLACLVSTTLSAQTAAQLEMIRIQREVVNPTPDTNANEPVEEVVEKEVIVFQEKQQPKDINVDDILSGNIQEEKLSRPIATPTPTPYPMAIEISVEKPNLILPPFARPLCSFTVVVENKTPYNLDNIRINYKWGEMASYIGVTGMVPGERFPIDTASVGEGCRQLSSIPQLSFPICQLTDNTSENPVEISEDECRSLVKFVKK